MYVKCIECIKGINGEKSCGCGAFEKSPMLGCFLGEKMEVIYGRNHSADDVSGVRGAESELKNQKKRQFVHVLRQSLQLAF